MLHPGMSDYNTELAEAERNRAWLEAILSIAPSAIISIDARQQVTLFNEAAEKMFGYRRDEVIGQPLTMLIPPRMRSVHTQDVELFGKGVENTRRMGERRSVAGLRKDNSEFPAEASISKTEIEGERIYIVALQDVTEHKRQRDHILFLMGEVNHRSKNLFAVVQAVARQTLKAKPDDLARFGERIEALAASQDLLVKNEWKNVNLHDLIRSQLGHFKCLIGGRIGLTGPRFSISAPAAQTIGMALHELASNASKYGALSNDEGRVDIKWSMEGGEAGEKPFRISWRETGGPAVHAPEKSGFGSAIITSVAETNLDAEVELSFPVSGLVWRLTCLAREVTDGCNLA